MANLSNINNKFLFTDGDFLKIGNLAPINNISGTESGISVTNSNVASITLDSTAASGKKYVMYSSGNGSLVFWDGDAASARLQIDSSGNATFAGTIASNNIAITNSGNGELSVTRTSGATVKSIAQSARGQIGTSSNHELQLITNATSRLTIDTSGNSTFAGNVTVGTGIIKPSIGGDIAITQGAIGLRINDAASAISPTTATSNNDNAVDLGVSNIRFRNLYMGGNGTFGGNVTVNGEARVYTGTNFGYWGVDAGNSYVYLGTNSSGYGLSLQTAGTERMRITSGGGVSIGSTNPSLDTSLRVFKAGVSVQARIGESNSAYSTLGQNSLIRFQGRNTANTASVYGDIGLDVDNQLLIFNDPGTTGGSVGTNPMVLDAAGNLGIGTTSPSAKLEVRGTAPTYTNSSTVFWGGTTNNDSHNGIMLSSYGDALGGSLASNLLYSNSNTPTQTNTNRSSGQIKFGNTTVAAKTSDINFGGYYKGTTTFVERMRIDNSGNVGIGDTAPTSISINTSSLSVGSSRNDLSGGLISKANGTVKHQQYWDSSGYSFNITASSGVFKFNGADIQVNANIKANDIDGKFYSMVASWAYVASKNDLFSYPGNGGALWEYTIKMNPNSAGSGLYSDFYYGKLGIGIGWNGSNVTQYIWQQQDQTAPRTLYGSGGGNYNPLFRMYYSGGVYTELAYGTAWTLRIQGLSTSTYGDIFFRRLA